jgi:hypothetical protein
MMSESQRVDSARQPVPPDRPTDPPSPQMAEAVPQWRPSPTLDTLQQVIDVEQALP